MCRYRDIRIPTVRLEGVGGYGSGGDFGEENPGNQASTKCTVIKWVPDVARQDYSASS